MSHNSQSVREDIANCVSHGIGAVAALVGTPFLIVTAAPKGARAIVAVSIFAATMTALYLASTLYHAWRWPKTKALLRRVDHSAIFLLIAGTYTPFTLGVLKGAWGWTLFGVIWAFAVLGVIAKCVWGERWPRLSLSVYLAMGWLVVVAAVPLVQRVSPSGLAWLVAGGVAYTGGTAFYVANRVRYSHLAWHLCVLAGTTCHYFAVLWYAA